MLGRSEPAQHRCNLGEIMTDRLVFLYYLWSAFCSIGLVHMLICWVALRRNGIGAPEFQVFYGKPIARFLWRGTSFQLGWIPMGMFVKWDEEQYPRAPWLFRAGMPLLGPLAAALAALVLLGSDLWLEQVTKSFAQIIRAALHPFLIGVPLLQAFHQASVPTAAFIGIVWVKYAAFHLIPLPTLPGGSLWTECLRHWKEGKPLELIHTGGALVILGSWLVWLVAIGYFLWQPSG